MVTARSLSFSPSRLNKEFFQRSLICTATGIWYNIMSPLFFGDVTRHTNVMQI